MPRRKAPRDPEAVRGKLRPHDPFDLIRWLAYSQPDPRKALTELVQNSLDAGARRIRVTRLRERGVTAVLIFDDGSGVIPEMERVEALRFLATHIGYSRKRDLSPQQRLELMTQGQYGIGLLGFWSLGERLDMRTAVAGQKPHRLVLHRDRPDYEIEPLRGRLPLEETWTEVVISSLHAHVGAALAGRRIADYLAAELRGQILARSADLVYEDRAARGRAQKVIHVRPQRFEGERLAGVDVVPVPGYPPIRLELYASVGDASAVPGATPSDLLRGRCVMVYAAGTLVAEGFHELAGVGLDRPPWTDARLHGLLDFPALRVAPGARRGLVMGPETEAFVAALAGVEAPISARLAELERAREEELEQSVVRDLQRAFRDLVRMKPRYALPRLADGGARAPGGVTEAGRGDETAPGLPPAPRGDTADGVDGSDTTIPSTGLVGDRSAVQEELFPRGPLDRVVLVPAEITVACGGARRVRASATDAAGGLAEEPLSYEWELDERAGRLEFVGAKGDPLPSPSEVVVRGAESPADGWLRVKVTSGRLSASTDAPVHVVDRLTTGRSSEGIPPPVLIDDRQGTWRSRWREQRWEVNAGHRDYRSVCAQPSLKLRYLSLLFAKEVVLMSASDPRLEGVLEQLVEVQAFADRNLARRRRGSGASESPSQ